MPKLPIGEAWVNAHAEKPLKDAARKHSASSEEKAVLDKFGEKEGDEAATKYRLFTTEGYTDRGWSMKDARLAVGELSFVRNVVADHKKGKDFGMGIAHSEKQIREIFAKHYEAVPDEVVALFEQEKEFD